MRDSLLSVIICVRDGERFLSESLDSIAYQEIGDLATIVVDDGSRDNSALIAKHHSLKPTVISQDPLGLGAALNTGIRTASGRLLAFLDCDDVWPEGRLSAMLQALEQDQGIDIVTGKAVNTDEDIHEIDSPLPARILGALLVKRAAALKVGEFRTDIAHAANVDWISRAAALGLHFHALNKIVLLRRIHGGNMGIRDRPRARTDLLRVLREHLKRTRQ
jgi:glycosyltransferase involved in cell wall biosynthesis